MDRVLKRDGWTTIETLISLPILIFILFAAVEYWGVLTMHQYTESIKYNALATMEVEGGLPLSKLNEVEDSLIKIGADPETIVIQGDILTGQPVNWPNEVFLRIEYTPINFNSFMSRVLIGGSPSAESRIGVEGSVISSVIGP